MFRPSKRGVSELQTIAAAGFEQVSDFSFSKIFDLVAEYMNIGTAGKGAGAIERAESNVQPGKNTIVRLWEIILL